MSAGGSLFFPLRGLVLAVAASEVAVVVAARSMVDSRVLKVVVMTVAATWQAGAVAGLAIEVEPVKVSV